MNTTTTIYFDFETGGILPDHPSIQLAAIAVDDQTGKELDAFEQKIAFNPNLCDPEALKINRYDPESWINAASPQITAAKFAKFLQPHKCVQMFSKKTGLPFYVAKAAGYNALTFDWPRLRSLFGDSFLPVSYHVRDILQRVIFFFDETNNPPPNFKLSTVCDHFAIQSSLAHDALADVRMTAALYQKISKKIP